MQKVLYLLTLLLITVYTYADVSPVVINRLTNNEGLSNSSVNVIYQDSNNLMWFGTWDGLNLYNSREFKTFKPNPNVPGNITNNPLAELNKRIFKSANRFVVNVVYILKDCKCTYFP